MSQAIPIQHLGAALRAVMEVAGERHTRTLRFKVLPEALARLEARVIAKTNDEGLVDMGLFKLAWRVKLNDDGGELVNTAPYASVLEFGRRPNRPGPPRAPLLEWIRRKLVPNGKIVPEEGQSIDQAAVEASYRIRNHIHKHGTPGRMILGNATRDDFPGYLDDAVELHFGSD